MKHRIIAAIAILALIMSSTSCGASDSTSTPAVSASEQATVEEITTEPETAAVPDKEGLYSARLERFEVTSESLTDGVWNEEISSTDKGSNKSPQLAWDPVEGAGSYAVYMIDYDANNYLHWSSAGITDTELPAGWASESEYTGPFPPGGEQHEYAVYVIALKELPEKLPGVFSPDNEKVYTKLDTTSSGSSGNIISYAQYPECIQRNKRVKHRQNWRCFI